MFPVRYGKPHPRRWPIPEPAKRVIENCDPWTYYRIFQTAGYSVAQKVQAIEEFCAVPPGTVSDCFPEINDRGIVGRLMRPAQHPEGEQGTGEVDRGFERIREETDRIGQGPGRHLDGHGCQGGADRELDRLLGREDLHRRPAEPSTNMT